MPKLSDKRETEELKLPKTGGTVELLAWITQGEDDRIQKAYVAGHKATVNPDTGEVKQEAFAFDMEDFYRARDLAIEILLVGWDMTDEKDEALPITKENLSRLPSEDFEVISDKVDKFLSDRRGTDEAKKRKSKN